MAANLTAVRAWTTEQRTERLVNFTKVVKAGLNNVHPNLINEIELADFKVIVDAFQESQDEETILVEETVTKAVYDAYVAAHP